MITAFPAFLVYCTVLKAYTINTLCHYYNHNRLKMHPHFIENVLDVKLPEKTLNQLEPLFPPTRNSTMPLFVEGSCINKCTT